LDKNEFRAAVAAAGLEHLAETLEKLALPSIRLAARPVPQAELVRGASQIGGLPDLPPGQTWPHAGDDGTRQVSWGEADVREGDDPLPFLAQINFAEVAPFDVTCLLPAVGTLLFFCDPQTGVWRLLYHTSAATDLQPQSSWPGGLSADNRFETHALTPRAEFTLPPYGLHGSYGGEEHTFFDVLDPVLSAARLTDSEEEAYDELCRQLSGWNQEAVPGAPENEHHRMLGWAEYVQNPMKLDLQLASSDEGSLTDLRDALWDAEDPRTVAFKAETEATEWTLLLQVDSIFAAYNMTWGDGGTHYLWIKKADLQRSDFSQVHYESDSC